MRQGTLAPLLLVALLLGACGNDDEPRAGAAEPKRTPPEATIARWVKTGDCSLMTGRYVGDGYRSVGAGRRACQTESDKTAPEPYRVQEARVDGEDAMVIATLRDGTRLTFWLVAHGDRGWRIDGAEEQHPRDAEIGAAEVIEAFERETGERLDRLGRFSRPSYQVLGFREHFGAGATAEELSPKAHELVEKFGVFSLYVVESVDEAKDVIQGEGPDDSGIHWKRDEPEPGKTARWTAEKRYDNVVLVWTGEEIRRINDSFKRVDSILRRATRRDR